MTEKPIPILVYESQSNGYIILNVSDHPFEPKLWKFMCKRLLIETKTYRVYNKKKGRSEDKTKWIFHANLPEFLNGIHVNFFDKENQYHPEY